MRVGMVIDLDRTAKMNREQWKMHGLLLNQLQWKHEVETVSNGPLAKISQMYLL